MGVKAISKFTGQYEISSGFSKRDLRRLVSNRTVKHLQFSNPLSLKEIDRLENIVFAERPDISLRVYGHYSSDCDLTFLQRIPSLKRLSIDSLMNASGIEVVTELPQIEMLGVGIFELDSFDFLNRINSNLKELLLHQTRSKKPKIHSINRFEKLEYLYLESQQKGIDSITDLKNIKEISLRSVSTPNLDFLVGKPDLWSVDIKLGGVRDFEILKTLQNLKYLELWQIRGLSDLTFISELSSLQNLFIQSLKQVETLPDFKRLKHLRRIHLENLRGLHDLSSLKQAPALEEFVYLLAENQQPKNLKPLLENEALKSALCRFGSDKKNNEFDTMLTNVGLRMYNSSEFEYV